MLYRNPLMTHPMGNRSQGPELRDISGIRPIFRRWTQPPIAARIHDIN